MEPHFESTKDAAPSISTPGNLSEGLFPPVPRNSNNHVRLVSDEQPLGQTFCYQEVPQSGWGYPAYSDAPFGSNPYSGHITYNPNGLCSV